MFELLFDLPKDLSKVYYYLHITNLKIKSEIYSVEHNRDEIYIQFSCGNLSISSDSAIIKVNKPKESEEQFEFCYLIKNRDGEVLGYIAMPCESNLNSK